MNVLKFKSFSLITICFNIACVKPFYKVDKYIENFEYVTDDGYNTPKVTEDPFKIVHYLDSPKRNLAKDTEQEYKAIKKEYLKELKEETAKKESEEDARKANELVKANEIAEEHNGKDIKLLNKIGCGDDYIGTTEVVEGPADIESFPWLGVLIYQKGKDRLTTTVVLVARNAVIGSALDIEKLPKIDFRKKSKVVLGRTCKHPGIRVLDYNYHPDYGKDTFSSLVLIQIDVENATQVLRPICGPPNLLEVSNFYTITLPHNCKQSKVEIFSMDHVKQEDCKHYYRRTGLDIETIWPKHGACGRARTEDECLWRNGAALVVKQNGRWHLMGFGVNGPGCAAPSRYVDYVAYSKWVEDSVAGIGRPALTRLADNELILRRSADKIQRYGPCDSNEVQVKLFCDITNATNRDTRFGRVRYNLTLIEDYEYTCIFIQATSRFGRPKITMKGVCDSPHPICYSASRFQLDFYIVITFVKQVWYRICAYGREVRVPDPKGKLKYFNMKIPPVYIPNLYSNGTTEQPMKFVTEVGINVTGDFIDTDSDDSDTDTEEETHTEPRLPPEDEFATATQVVDKTDVPVNPTDGLWSQTPFPHETDAPIQPSGDFWSLTPIRNETSTPVNPTDGFSSHTPETDAPFQPSNDFWSHTPIWNETTDGVWSEMPISNETDAPFQPGDDFWSHTPIVGETDTPFEQTGINQESSSPSPKQLSGEFWTISPVATEGDESSPKPIAPLGDFWSVVPIATTSDDSYKLSSPKHKDILSSPKPNEPFDDFWTVTLIPTNEDYIDDLLSPSPKEPSGKIWSVAPIANTGDDTDELSSPKPTEHLGEFWSHAPIATESKPEEPTEKGEKSQSLNPNEPKDDFWTYAPILTEVDEPSSPKLGRLGGFSNQPIGDEADGGETGNTEASVIAEEEKPWWTEVSVTSTNFPSNKTKEVSHEVPKPNTQEVTDHPVALWWISTQIQANKDESVSAKNSFLEDTTPLSYHEIVTPEYEIPENEIRPAIDVDEYSPPINDVSDSTREFDPNLTLNTEKELTEEPIGSFIEASQPYITPLKVAHHEKGLSDMKGVKYAIKLTRPPLWYVSSMELDSRKLNDTKDVGSKDSMPMYDENMSGTTDFSVSDENIPINYGVENVNKEEYDPIPDWTGIPDAKDTDVSRKPIGPVLGTGNEVNNIINEHETNLSPPKWTTPKPSYYFNESLKSPVSEILYDSTLETDLPIDSLTDIPIDFADSFFGSNKVASDKLEVTTPKPIYVVTAEDTLLEEKESDLEKVLISMNDITAQSELVPSSDRTKGKLEDEIELDVTSAKTFGELKDDKDYEGTSAKSLTKLTDNIGLSVKMTAPLEPLPSTARTNGKLKDKIELLENVSEKLKDSKDFDDEPKTFDNIKDDRELDATSTKTFGKLKNNIKFDDASSNTVDKFQYSKDFDVTPPIPYEKLKGKINNDDTSPISFEEMKDIINFDVSPEMPFEEMKDNINFDVSSPKHFGKLNENIDFDGTPTKEVNTKEFSPISQGSEESLEKIENQFEGILDLARVTKPSDRIEATSTKPIYESLLNEARNPSKTAPDLNEILTETATTVRVEFESEKSEIQSQKEVDVGNPGDILRMVKLRLGNNFYSDRFVTPVGKFDVNRKSYNPRKLVTPRQRITENAVFVF